MVGNYDSLGFCVRLCRLLLAIACVLKGFSRGGSMRNANAVSLNPRRHWVCSLLALMLFHSVVVWCQDQANIVGIVTDSSGAVIAGAKVTVANSQRGFIRETSSNTEGEFTVSKV